MSPRISKLLKNIFICIYLIGFALTVPMLFFIAAHNTLVRIFEVDSPVMRMVGFMSVSFYISWMGGVFSTVVKDMNEVLRAVLTTICVNILTVILLESQLAPQWKVMNLFLIILVNSLVAVLSSRIYRKVHPQHAQDPILDSEALVPVAMGLPLPFFATIWLVIIILIKLLR
ncbi:MAG: hypothetical protein H6756_12625 [Candidatus Omnitrophica bacterium]|nr:hypothetical protein [Candidatus Omnitrophota bacterium]